MSSEYFRNTGILLEISIMKSEYFTTHIETGTMIRWNISFNIFAVVAKCKHPSVCSKFHASIRNDTVNMNSIGTISLCY